MEQKTYTRGTHKAELRRYDCAPVLRAVVVPERSCALRTTPDDALFRIGTVLEFEIVQSCTVSSLQNSVLTRSCLNMYSCDELQKQAQLRYLKLNTQASSSRIE
jgi:hypothetical protein